MCSSVRMSGTVWSVNILADYNIVCIYVGTSPIKIKRYPQALAKTYAAYGIAIQKVASPDTSAGVVIIRVESN